MKMRGIVLALAVVALTATPALADEYARDCVSIVGPNGNGMGIGCSSIQTRDFRPGHIEGFTEVVNYPAGASVQYDWIHLYRNNQLLASDGRTPWWGAGTSYSTAWRTCDQHALYRSVSRMRVQRANGTTSIWYTVRSNDWEGTNWCQPLRQGVRG